jgi:hypothetical protein
VKRACIFCRNKYLFSPFVVFLLRAVRLPRLPVATNQRRRAVHRAFREFVHR